MLHLLLATSTVQSLSPALPCILRAQVRRKADPAKGLVKDWVLKWRDDRFVRGSVSHDQLSGDHANTWSCFCRDHHCSMLLHITPCTHAVLRSTVHDANWDEVVQQCYSSLAATTRRMEPGQG